MSNDCPVSLSDLQAKLHEVFLNDKIDKDYVQFLMESYVAKPSEWQKYAKWNPHTYTRNLVDAGNDKFNLMILCWPESIGCSIHSHADSHCFYKMLKGSLAETQFEWPKEGEVDTALVIKNSTTLFKQQVGYINDNIGLHRMENPSHTEGAVSLHLYCPPYQSCTSFDEKTGHTVMSKMTFYSKFGEKVPLDTKTLNTCPTWSLAEND